jgi:hypothetical protein
MLMKLTTAWRPQYPRLKVILQSDAQDGQNQDSSGLQSQTRGLASRPRTPQTTGESPTCTKRNCPHLSTTQPRLSGL